MSSPITTIAAKLAAALRNMPCVCVTTGTWPRFKDVKAHPERTCSRCKALAEYDAFVAIIESPANAAQRAKDTPND
jgi:hypothetical protein